MTSCLCLCDDWGHAWEPCDGLAVEKVQCGKAVVPMCAYCARSVRGPAALMTLKLAFSDAVPGWAIRNAYWIWAGSALALLGFSGYCLAIGQEGTGAALAALVLFGVWRQR